ncbi:MAG: fumarylacetoacetate hydrolase family protein [Oligoflexales bacterium]|nr:fumarylacetoacetate hydrolase family protein [Oligoflexales bacterium]
MKLGTLKNGKRDGLLVVVSRDLERYIPASGVCQTLQAALDDWDNVSPLLNKIYQDLVRDQKTGEKTDFTKFHSPLPRAYEWIDGSAYINHVVLVRKARGAEPPATLKTDPLVYQGGSGVFLGPREPIAIKNLEWGLDFESEVCVILGDTPQGTTAQTAEDHIKLVMLANDVSLRNLIPSELEKGFGFFTSKPATAFSPVAVTKDELGADWKQSRLHRPLITHYNGTKFGDPNAGPEMYFSFGDLMQHICKTRSYTAGTILGSGTVSNEDRTRGSSCLAEKRMIEKIDNGTITTPFMNIGDTIEIEMFDDHQKSIFGKISQKVIAL